MSKEDGGQAFPNEIKHIEGNYVQQEGSPETREWEPSKTYISGGMTLRQYFAGQALVGLLANSNDITTKVTFEDAIKKGETNSNITWARLSFEQADAMIAEGGKNG